MKVKKIYVEGLGLVEGHFSGVGQYILGILRGLDEIIDKAKYAGEPVPEIKVIIPYNTVGKFKSYGFKHIGHKSFPLSFRVMSILWYKGLMPPIDLWCGKGSYIFTRFVGMPLVFNKSATIIYDISYELYKQYSDDRNARFLSKRVKQTIRKANKIITISQNAKNEIVDFYNLRSEDVVVVTPAADSRQFYKRSAKEIDKVKLKYGIEGDYILALSNLEPRKNLGALVDAYCSLPKKYTDNVALLLVGVSGWKTKELFQEIVKKAEAGYNIIRPSRYVLDEDKPAIMSGAKFLVFPSHYEGFGMPPLEALSCGTPVISANNSSLPEAVGTAGKLINIDDPNVLVAAMEEYITNNESLTEKAGIEGPKQSEKFSWVDSAQSIIDLAEKL